MEVHWKHEGMGKILVYKIIEKGLKGSKHLKPRAYLGNM
jgi:hypothetical protein